MNIGMLLTKNAKLFPEKPAIIHGKRVITFEKLNKGVNQLSNGLKDLGVKTGENVAILQYNYPETIESLFACFKSGLGAVPINFRLHPKEFAFIINHSEAKVVILSSEFNESIIDVIDLMPKVEYFITIGNSTDRLISYENLLKTKSQKFKEVDVSPDDLAWLFYTSGTTGMPKGAMLSHRNLLAMSMNFYADIAPGFNPDDVVLHAAPLSHGSGLYCLPNIGKGATNIILNSKSFDVKIVLETIQKYKVTNMFAAPTMIKMLIDYPNLENYNIGSLRALNYGGAPMLVEDLKKAIKKLGNCLVQLFGQGESPMTISYLPHWAHRLEGSDRELNRLSSAGFARTDVEVNIFDENENEVSPNTIGEIVTRSDIVMKGYWKNPEATANTIKNGWLHTGDMGYLDEEGFLFIMDRSKDMIISGGENIYPREIEEVLIRHPAVREVSVIGVPDEKWGEAIKGIVALNPGSKVTEEELIDFCKRNIASYKKPKSIDFIQELPKNNYGKILKREIRAKYWENYVRKV